MLRNLLLIVCATGLFGCGDDAAFPDAGGASFDAATPPPDADPPDATPTPLCVAPIDPGANHTQFVADALAIPTTASEAMMLGINLDDDDQGRPDNAFGQIMATLASQSDLGIQDTVDALVNGGELLYLFDFDAADLATAASATVLHVMGRDCDDPPNPANNFSGDQPFTLADDTTESTLTGAISQGALDIGPGNMTLRMVMLTPDPIDVPLIGARIHGAIDANGIANGIIGGAILDSDVQTIVIPEIAAGLQGLIDAQCTASPPNCCPDGSTGQTILDLFDEDGDCAITATELQNNSLISSLFAPDVDLLDSTNGDIFAPRVDGINDSLSVGIGFSAVGAQFERPTPMP